jgi:ketosteroid isomerase-like protein
MNRRVYAFAIAVLFVSSTLCGLAAAQNIEDQIKKLETDRAAAVVKGDVAFLEKQTSDDYTIITMNGQTSGKTQMLDGFKSGASKLTADDLSDMRVKMYGNTAIITGKANVKGTLGGSDATGEIMFTRVWVKKGGRWQTVAFQQTRISNP